MKKITKIIIGISGVLIIGSAAVFAFMYQKMVNVSYKDNRKDVKDDYLVASSFEVKGVNGKATITKKTGIVFPEQVKILYDYSKVKSFIESFKKNQEKGKDHHLGADTYNKQAPTNLSNGDIVGIKFFIKDEYKKSHKLSASFITRTRKKPITITVKNL